METIIRREKPGDESSIRRLILGAFPGDQEALVVDRLRDNGRLLISLVAEIEGSLVGHVAFSPVVIKNVNRELIGAGLAPLAVLPEW